MYSIETRPHGILVWYDVEQPIAAMIKEKLDMSQISDEHRGIDNVRLKSRAETLR